MQDDLPFYLRYPVKFFSFFPEINTVAGLIAYSAFFYFVYMIILLVYAYLNRNETDNRVRGEAEFRKNLEKVRNIKSEQAQKLLKNLYPNHSKEN